MSFIKAVISLVLIWGLALLTVYLLKDWGPLDAFVKYAAEGNVLMASGLLAAVVILILLLLYAFGKLLDWLGVIHEVARKMTRIGNILTWW